MQMESHGTFVWIIQTIQEIVLPWFYYKSVLYFRSKPQQVTANKLIPGKLTCNECEVN